MIGLLFELVEIFIKMSILMIWLSIVMVIWMFWAVGALIALCAKQPVPKFPRDVSRQTEHLMRHLF